MIWSGIRGLGRPFVWVFRPLYRWVDNDRNSPTPAPPSPFTFVAIGVVAVLLASITVLFALGTSAPQPPYVPVATVGQVGTSVFDSDRDLLFVAGADDSIHAFFTQEPSLLVYCEANQHIEGEGGRVWDREGRALDGGASLMENPIEVDGDKVYLNEQEATQLPAGQNSNPPQQCEEQLKPVRPVTVG